MTRRLLAQKLVVALVGLAFLAAAGRSFYRSRHLREVVVPGPGVTAIRTLGDYFGPIRGTTNDCHVYVLEGQAPGATILVLGGSHPEEPAGRLAAWILAENAVVAKGRLVVVLSANRSATTVTRLGGAYPPTFAIQTAWGERVFRMGDRWTNPLDQWPDPEVSIHYPTRQELAYVDVRNLNRAWPGRPDVTLPPRQKHLRKGRETLDALRDEQISSRGKDHDIFGCIFNHCRSVDVWPVGFLPGGRGSA